jgi:phage gp29-like protein
VLGIRKRAVSGVEPTVTPASDSSADKKIADDVREKLAEHVGFSDLVEDMLDALGKGFSQTEIVWGKGKRDWWIEEFVHRDPRFFTFDRDTGREVRLIDEQDMVDGLELQSFKWISHKAKLKSGLPIRGGLARLVAFGWMCKAYTVKDWIAFVETYGLPLRLGRYGPSATANDVDTLFRAVANIGTDAAAVLPESMRIDFEQIANGQGNDIFETLARWTDEQTSKAVLGQTMTSDNGSSMAQAQVHNEVRHDVAASDAKSVSSTLNRDLVKPFVDLNHGVQDDYPIITIVIEEAEDVDKIIQNVDRMAGRGVRFKQSEVRARLGFSEPDDNDEVIGGSVPPAKTDKTATALNRATDPASITDDLEDDLNAGWEDVMTAMLKPVIELLETATDYDDAIALVGEAFPKMNDQALIDALVKSAVKARAEGDRPSGGADVDG